VRLDELAGEIWATGYAGGGMRALVQRVCATHGGFEPIVRHQTNELSMLVGLVARGHAITMLPEIAFAGGHEGVIVRPVAGLEANRTVFIATRAGAGHRPALAAVRAALRTASPSSRPAPSGSS
jgi:DNA-binding transcriptional LysR family regulator